MLSYRMISEELKVGELLRSTDVLDVYPHYFIKPGARFILVQNNILERGMIALRLHPEDRGHLVEGDISEWADCLEFHGPEQDGQVNDEGVADGDILNPAHSWNRLQFAIAKDPNPDTADAIAAIITHEAGLRHGDGMADVVRANAAAASDVFDLMLDAPDDVVLGAFRQVVGKDALEDEKADIDLIQEALIRVKRSFSLVHLSDG